MNEAPLRLRRIVDPKTGRAVLLSFTSAMEVGILRGMEDLADSIGRISAGGDITAAIVHAGVQDSVFRRDADLPCGTLVDLFGGTWMTTRPDRREQVCSLEHAVRVGADGVLVTIGLGSADESRQLRICGQISRDCAAWGMPLVVRIDTTDTDARRQYAATQSGHGARLAYELGADLAVVNYSGDEDGFREALRGIDIPVLIGGAPNMATDETLLESIRQAIVAGAQGVALNASMFWDEGPNDTLKELASIVLGEARTPSEKVTK